MVRSKSRNEPVRTVTANSTCTKIRGSVVRTLMWFVLCGFAFWPSVTRAQDNYEIQVYASETITPKTLLLESHNNFTAEGNTATPFGMLPHATPATRNSRINPGHQCLVRNWFLHLHCGKKWQWRAVGWRSHTPSRSGSLALALAGESQSVDRVRLREAGFLQSNLVVANHASIRMQPKI
jgi:hypothetical protein